MEAETLFWRAKDDQDAADGLRAHFARFASTQSARRELAEKYARCTEGMNLTSLGPYGYDYDTNTPTFDESQIPIIRNAAHALVDTLTSKIGAIDPPLPTMLTNKGSWKDRRQANDLEQLTRAEYTTPKGFHSTLHDLWIAALKLAGGATGSAAVQYYNDGGKVGARLHDTLDMIWSDDLRMQGCVTWLPVEEVVEMYPDSEVDIRSSAGDPPAEWGAPIREGQKLTDYVAVYEGWYGASAQGKRPGRYVVCVKNGPALLNDPYKHPKPPIVWLTCIPHLYGPLGHSMLHHVYESIKRDNLILARVDRAIQKTTESTTYAAKESFVNPEALVSTEDHKVVWLKDETSKPPTTESPAGFSAEHLVAADRHNQDAYAVSGMAQSHTEGVRQEGVDSAIGQRYVAALVNERFAALQRRYVQAVAVDSAYVIIQILCDIFEDEPKMLRLAPGQDTLREVSGALALNGIDALKYVITGAAVSGNKGGPADRMQSAYELKQLGILTDDEFADMQGRGYDLPEELAEVNVQRRYIDEQMHTWMFASDEEFEKPGFYVAPPVGFQVPEAILQVFHGYLEAQIDKLEPERLDLFLMYMGDLQALAPPPAAPEPAVKPPGITPLPPLQGIAA